MHELLRCDAVEVLRRLRRGEVTPLDLLDLLEQRVGDVDGVVNALPIRCFERARRAARAQMRRPPGERGLLAGLPVAIKDLSAVAGVRCTAGSRVHAERVAETSDLVVERLEAAGGVVYAKSNTPEFGAGGHTFNDVFGTTLNPRDTRLSAGGSSGGAAAALASGMAWLAQGSDLAGSLRTPAAFCGVASLRPSPGRIADGPLPAPFEVLAAEGPMARSVADLGLLAEAMSGEHPLAGICAPAAGLAAAAATPARPRRVAVSDDLGIASVDAQVLAVFHRFVDRLADAGVEVVTAHPDFAGVDETFDVLRALDYATSLGDLDQQALALVKPEVRWNIASGLSLSGARIAAARRHQGRLYHAAAAFCEDVDLLICPASRCLPFPAEQRWPGHDGLPVSAYYRWLSIAYALTVVGLPVVTLPVGHADHLPVAVQLVGRAHGDAALLSQAAWVEAGAGFDRGPLDPVSG